VLGFLTEPSTPQGEAQFADESEALTHPYLAHVWAKKGADLRVPAPGQSAKVAMLGVLDWARRELIVHTSRTKRSSDFIALLEEVDRRYGPKLGVAITPIGFCQGSRQHGSCQRQSNCSRHEAHTR
jgi:hypothetical protein